MSNVTNIVSDSDDLDLDLSTGGSDQPITADASTDDDVGLSATLGRYTGVVQTTVISPTGKAIGQGLEVSFKTNGRGKGASRHNATVAQFKVEMVNGKKTLVYRDHRPELLAAADFIQNFRPTSLQAGDDLLSQFKAGHEAVRPRAGRQVRGWEFSAGAALAHIVEPSERKGAAPKIRQDKARTGAGITEGEDRAPLFVAYEDMPVFAAMLREVATGSARNNFDETGRPVSTFRADLARIAAAVAEKNGIPLVELSGSEPLPAPVAEGDSGEAPPAASETASEVAARPSRGNRRN
jgi:hypothetical protein